MWWNRAVETKNCGLFLVYSLITYTELETIFLGFTEHTLVKQKKDFNVL